MDSFKTFLTLYTQYDTRINVKLYDRIVKHNESNDVHIRVIQHSPVHRYFLVEYTINGSSNSSLYCYTYYNEITEKKIL